MKINTNPSTLKRKRLALLGAGILLIALIAVGVFLYIGRQNHTNDTGSTDDSASKPTPATSTSNGSGPVTGSSEPNTPAPALDTSITPTAPSGVFVSNHRPNLSGSPAPNSITSTCSTTPGADCTIRFVMGGTVKSLAAQTVGADGNVSWTWTLQEIGLTVGEWSVSAIATNGDKMSSSDDALKLVVAE